MILDQAVAILEAERVLRHVDWHDYVTEAVGVILLNPLFCDEFDDLQVVTDIKEAADVQRSDDH